MRVRIESLSNVRTLAPARRFKPYDVANPSNTFEEHVIHEIVHTASDRSYETNAGDPEYSNSFIAIPSGVPATPHRTTPRLRIDGTQIALVAGPEGEEIHPDEYGRQRFIGRQRRGSGCRGVQSDCPRQAVRIYVFPNIFRWFRQTRKRQLLCA
jgi:uncharacterized protein involved in type VI secretion and phage assembly